MATDIIARGMAAGSIKPGSDGKIPAEYLPSYIDDVVDLIAVTDTAPATCAEGDKYYNTTDKLIYTATATNTWGTTGTTPEDGKIYLDISKNPSESYRWSGTELVIIGQDLSDYYTKEDTNALLNSLQTIFVHDASYGASASNPIIFSDLKPGTHILQLNRDSLIYAKASPSHEVDTGYSLANMVETKLYVVKTYTNDIQDQVTLAYIYQYYTGGNERIQLNMIKSYTNSTSGIGIFPGINVNSSIGYHTGYQTETFYKGAKFLNNTYPIMNNMSAMPTQNNELVPKQYVDGLIPQVATLPTAASTNEGRIYQFIGTTDANYTNGYFYQCVSDGAVEPTYSWTRIDVQPSPDVATPDWNENDSSSPHYIENRTHYYINDEQDLGETDITGDSHLIDPPIQQTTSSGHNIEQFGTESLVSYVEGGDNTLYNNLSNICEQLETLYNDGITTFNLKLNDKDDFTYSCKFFRQYQGESHNYNITYYVTADDVSSPEEMMRVLNNDEDLEGNPVQSKGIFFAFAFSHHDEV